MEPHIEVLTLRSRAGLTQAELAARCGTSQPNIAAFEAGTRVPSTRMMERLRAAAPPKPSAALLDHLPQVLELVRENRAFNPRVFGSVARREDVSGSDLDLMVEFEEGASLFDLAQLAYRLEDLLGVDVDIITEEGLGEGALEIRAQAIPVDELAVPT